MGKRIARIFLTLAGGGVGLGLAALVYEILNWAGIDLRDQFVKLKYEYINIIIYAGSALLFAIIFFLASYALIKGFRKMISWIEAKLQRFPMSDIVAGSIGLIVGLLIAFLLTNVINQIKISWLSAIISVVLYLVLGYLGLVVAVRRKHETNLPGLFKRKDKGSIRSGDMLSPKIIDTSVIIDGRIYDICKTGIVEGTLIIPGFVLTELRHIADSADSLKRNRGRRGLDILNRIQKELDIPVKVIEPKYEDELDVDSKLLKMADEYKAKIITNDFNLRKVATVQGVPILSVNELADSLKAVVLPGEEMTIQVVKEGKESGQGVAYLDDGTMIVVEGGKKYVGEDMDVLVTSVLQTAAGRMIFAKLKNL